MAYSSAVFFIDLYNGSDATRSTLTGVVFSNPSGSTVRGTKTAHGLVTGAVIDVTGCTQSYANSAWKITYVTADTFDLDGAVWSSFNGADVTGDAVPRGGSSWSDAWKTITTGATNARIAAGDTIRISKTPDPVSIGNATWTNDSQTITLATAQTANIDLCESGWSTDNGSTVGTGSAKQGSYSLYLTTGTPSTSQLLCHKTLTTTDFSSYQKISLWFNNATSAVSDGATLKVCLCSDTAGATIVDTFWIPAVASSGRYLPLVLTKEGGGNLGASIQSVAVYSGTTNPGNTKSFNFDNIIACTTNGLNLTSLISKNSSAQGGNEGFYGIQSIDGTTVKLDGDTNCLASATWVKYQGTTETVTTYIRDCFKTSYAASSSTVVNATSKNGTSSSYIAYEAGYNTSSGNQDGETYLSGSNSYGYGFSIGHNYNSLNWLSFSRYYNNILDSGMYTKIYNLCNCGNAGSYSIFLQGTGTVIDKIYNINHSSSSALSIYGNRINIKSVVNVICNNSSQIQFNGCFDINIIVQNIIGGSTGFYAIYGACNINASATTVSGQSSANIDCSSGKNIVFTIGSGSGGSYGVKASRADITLVNCTLAQSSEFYIAADDSSVITSLNHDATDGNHIVQSKDCQTVYQGTTFHGTDPGAWKMLPGSTRTTSWPVRLKLAEIAVSASSQVTAKAWIYKDHATNVSAKLLVLADSYFGISNDVSTTKASDTSWEEVTLTFTPTKAGVIPLYVEGWYVSGLNNIYIGSISVSQ